MVADLAQPICVNGGEFDKEARKMMDEEMRYAAAKGGMVWRSFKNILKT